MEKGLNRLFERSRKRSNESVMTNKELSQLIEDVDKVWVSDEMPEGGYMLIQSLRQLSESESAQALAELLIPHLDLSLNQRLCSAGIAVGELTPNESTPSGVRGMLRSDHPILLVTENEPDDHYRPIEIAREIGKMIYGRNEDSIMKFVQAFDASAALSSSEKNQIEDN